MMRHLLCMLAIAGAAMATVGCSSQSAAPTAADTSTDLGTSAPIDAGNPDSAGSTTN